MENELREIEFVTRELLDVLEGLWSECRGGYLRKEPRVCDNRDGPIYEGNLCPESIIRSRTSRDLPVN